MLWNASVINGYAIAASDGRLGTVSDFLFDDASWLVRWLVVDTGNWLSGRKVLLPPSVLGHLDSARREFSVGLTKQQVKDSPDIDTERPVSRQIETNIYDYYGWQPYWGTGLLMGGYDYGDGAMAVSPVPESRRLAEDIGSPGIISMPVTARLVTSRTSSSRMPIGASDISLSIRKTGGPGRRF